MRTDLSAARKLGPTAEVDEMGIRITLNRHQGSELKCFVKITRATSRRESPHLASSDIGLMPEQLIIMRGADGAAKGVVVEPNRRADFSHDVQKIENR